MELQAILFHLRMAEEHVEQGERLMRQQCQVLQRLACARVSVLKAGSILRTLEQSQALHLADRERFRAELQDNLGHWRS